MRIYMLTGDFFKRIFPKRDANSHKGDFGHVLVLAGSAGMTGAAALSSQAALRAGSGLVTLGIPASLNPVMEVKLTEVMTCPLAETEHQSLAPAAKPAIITRLEKVDSVALGPGLSQVKETQELIRELVVEVNKPIVIDADGINALAARPQILMNSEHLRIITPHPGEMARFRGIEISRVRQDREGMAREVARGFRMFVVLKGNRTVVASPDGETYLNSTGNPGMATAGMGDILTGIIAGFLAQKIDPFAACKAAVFLHGMAGDLAAEEKGQVSLTAGDVLDKLPVVFRKML